MVYFFAQRARRTGIPIILILTVLLLVGCNGAQDSSAQVETGMSEATTNTVKPIESVESVEASSATVSRETMVEYLPTPSTLDERFSYTYGYLLMATAMRDVHDIDPVYFARGAYDAGLSKTPLIPESSMNTVLFEFQDKLISEASRRLDELAKRNLEDAESFLAVNGKREGVVTTSSGLQYEVVRDSEGEKPSVDDTVKVHYRLTYLDGREGDASIRGIPSTFDLASMIPGFREGLMIMPVGSSYRFYVHPDLGYGVEGSTRIEPNTLLIFDVELVEIVQ